MPGWAQDVLLALFIAAIQVQGVGRVVENSEVTSRPLTELGHFGYVLLVASGLVLVVRRRWPVAVFVVTAVASVVYFVLDYPDGPAWLALFVALYTLTAHGDGRRSLQIAGVGIVCLSSVWLVAAADIEPRAALGWVFFRIGASVMSAALGESARSRRVIALEAQERAERAERNRDQEARARVDAERLRIAREVHDTVAHSIAVINVQAGVAAHVLDKRPEHARETLEAIERTSSRALQEMRTILGVLRGPSDDRHPHPGLGRLHDLTASAEAAGIDVEIETATPTEPLPSAVDSAAYRILQESITNVIRHVGPTRVTLSVTMNPDELRVRVLDEGRRGTDSPRVGNGAPSPAPGRGIRGMRERCELLGGELRVGPRPDGGFEVNARLPLDPVGSAR